MGKAVKTVVDVYMHDGKSIDAGPPVQSQGTCVRTNAIDPDEFSLEFARVIASYFRIAKEDVVYLRTWIEQAFEIMCKLRGYKADQVQEQRVLWTGHFSPWNAWQVEGSGIEGADGLPSSERDELLEWSFMDVVGGPGIDLQVKLARRLGKRRVEELVLQMEEAGRATVDDEWIEQLFADDPSFD